MNTEKSAIIRRIALIGIVSLISLLSLGCGNHRVESGNSAKSFGQYEFTLPKYDAGNINLSDYSGKVVLVNFWAEWCEPCKAETPGIVKIYDQYHGRGLEIIGIAEESKPEMAKQFIESLGMKYVVVHDDDGEIANKYNLDVYPESFLFDTKGNMVKEFRGYADEKDLSAEIDRLISSK